MNDWNVLYKRTKHYILSICLEYSHRDAKGLDDGHYNIHTNK